MNDMNPNNALSGSTTPSITSRERLQADADRLFSIDWRRQAFLHWLADPTADERTPYYDAPA